VIKIIAVYCMKEDNFTVVVDEQNNHSRLYRINEFAVQTVLGAANVSYVHCVMSLSKYKKAFPKKTFQKTLSRLYETS